MKLKTYEHDVVKLLDDFEQTLVQIESKGETFSNHMPCAFLRHSQHHTTLSSRITYKPSKINGMMARTLIGPPSREGGAKVQGTT